VIEKWPGGNKKLFGTISQRASLKHEFHHAGSKLSILGFEPFK
jgi:hypothetical protein